MFLEVFNVLIGGKKWYFIGKKSGKKGKKTALFSSNIKKKNKIIGYPPFFLVLYFTVSKREVK